MSTYQVEHYLTPDTQQDPFINWLTRLRDTQAKVAIIRRIARLQHGHFGNHKYCRNGIWELKVDTGPGYRIYYAMAGSQLVLLLGDGAKQTQNTDIQKATENWLDWQLRPDNEK